MKAGGCKLVFGLANLKTRSFAERGLTPYGENSPDHGAVSTLPGRDEGEFWGRRLRADPTGLEAEVMLLIREAFLRGVSTR